MSKCKKMTTGYLRNISENTRCFRRNRKKVEQFLRMSDKHPRIASESEQKLKCDERKEDRWYPKETMDDRWSPKVHWTILMSFNKAFKIIWTKHLWAPKQHHWESEDLKGVATEIVAVRRIRNGSSPWKISESRSIRRKIKEKPRSERRMQENRRTAKQRHARLKDGGGHSEKIVEIRRHIKDSWRLLTERHRKFLSETENLNKTMKSKRHQWKTLTFERDFKTPINSKEKPQRKIKGFQKETQEE